MSLEEKYRLTFELSPVGLLLVGPQGHIRLVNDNLAGMFEYAGDELIGQPIECLLPTAQRKGHPLLRLAYLEHPAKRQMGQGRDLQGQTRTGRLISLELGLNPIPFDGDTWTLVTAIDASARIRDEALLRATLNAAASAMVMVRIDGTIASLNRAAVDLFGYDESELLGSSVEILLPQDLRKVHQIYVQGFFESGSVRSMGTGNPLYARKKSGDQFRIEAALTPVDLEDENLVLATIVDLSERLATERALADKQAADAQARRLASMNDDLTRFAYSASHDLKSPLSTMTGILRLCLTDLETGDTEEVKENINKLIDLSESSAEKIESLLNHAQIGYDDIVATNINLGAIAQRLWASIIQGIPSSPQLHVSIEHDADFVSDKNSIEVILENLLSNALRFRATRGDGSWVRIETQQQRDRILISVEDNGLGVPDGSHEAVFDMFKKLDKRSGHGIGLAIVRRQIEELGGTIHCFSNRHEGTTFEMQLPMNRDQNESYK